MFFNVKVNKSLFGVNVIEVPDSVPIDAASVSALAQNSIFIRLIIQLPLRWMTRVFHLIVHWEVFQNDPLKRPTSLAGNTLTSSQTDIDNSLAVQLPQIRTPRRASEHERLSLLPLEK